jgi:hypothetical protein
VARRSSVNQTTRVCLVAKPSHACPVVMQRHRGVTRRLARRMEQGRPIGTGPQHFGSNGLQSFDERSEGAVADGRGILAQRGLEGRGEIGGLPTAPNFPLQARVFLDIRRRRLGSFPLAKGLSEPPLATRPPDSHWIA